jgi:F-type H+-transporting ATPase subunit delta
MSKVAVRYAGALIDVLSKPENRPNAGRVVEELVAFARMYGENPELRRTILTPAIPLAQKLSVIGKLCDHMGVLPVSKRFLEVLARHQRLNDIASVVEAVQVEIDARLGVARAKVSSALGLSDEQRSKLSQDLRRITGKEVHCEFAVDPSLLGGVSVQIGSKVYDGSVKGQLEAMRRQLSAGQTA